MKTAVIKFITRLPNPINYVFLAMNRSAGRIYGHGYKDYQAFLQKSFHGYDATPLLVETVNRAIENIPYYRRRLTGSRRIQSIEHFEDAIPFIDKDIIINHYEEFINPEIDLRDYDQGTTGGTSGKPLKLIAPKLRYIVEMATMHDLWSHAGYNFDPRAVIRNQKLKSDKKYIINPITREFIFDGFNLDEEYFEIIYRTIKKFGIRFIHCYPSTAYEFSKFLYANKYDTSFISAFLSGSENIFEYQTDLIQNRLGIRFYNWYGHSEKLILAGYCQMSDHYHVEPTYGYFELIDEDGKVIREPGRFGEMVGTGFHNPGMSFIRYRTGDYAEYVGDYCPACGRKLTLIKNIKGRWNGDKLYNPDGTFVTTTALNLHSDLYAVIEGIQYIQEKKGEVKILIIKSPIYNEQHEKKFIEHFRVKFKPGMVIKIEYVSKLRKLKNGKFLHIISSIKE